MWVRAAHEFTKKTMAEVDKHLASPGGLTDGLGLLLDYAKAARAAAGDTPDFPVAEVVQGGAAPEVVEATASTSVTDSTEEQGA